jgi:hypothetical protein
MLTVTTPVGDPVCGTARASISLRIASDSFDAPAASVLASTIANSSPPYRAGRSLTRCAVFRSTPAIFRSTSSPAWCP